MGRGLQRSPSASLTSGWDPCEKSWWPHNRFCDWTYFKPPFLSPGGEAGDYAGGTKLILAMK